MDPNEDPEVHLRTILSLLYHRMHLQHLHLPSLTPYLRASHLQSLLLAPHLSHAASPHPTPPPPSLLTFQTPPTYTTGRRENPHITPEQVVYLTATGASYYPALRGGQTTFHGPGQLTAYLILTLKTHSLRPRTYVQFLEESVMQTLACYGVATARTENPGVWVGEDRKIASVGVRMRRGVSSHGVGINVSVDLSWFDRVVACGLPEKRATSLDAEGVKGVQVQEIAGALAEAMVDGLEGLDGVAIMEEEEVEAVQEGEWKDLAS